jgi:hypothetical protein
MERPIGLWDVEAPTFCRRLTDGGEFVGLTRRPLFTHQEDSWVDPRAIMRLEGLVMELHNLPSTTNIVRGDLMMRSYLVRDI